MRKKLVFGGDRLTDPQYTWFYSALTRGMLHGHPGDEVLIVTQDEANELGKAVYDGLPRDVKQWGGAHQAQFSTFAGVKMILDSEAAGYVKNRQAVFVDTDDDPRAWLGLKRKKLTASSAVEKE